MYQYKDMTMEDINSKQKEFWSGSGGDVWVDKQSEMDIMLNPVSYTHLTLPTSDLV